MFNLDKKKSNTNKDLNMIMVLYGLWKHLRNKRKLQLFLLLLMMLLSAFAEVLSLASVIPFLSVLTDTDVLWDIEIIKNISNYFGINTAQGLLLPVTFIFSFAVITSAFIRLSNIRLNHMFAAAIGSDISIESYKRTLNQPYNVHIDRNSSSVITAITTQTDLSVCVINFALQLLTSSFISIAILVTLIFTKWEIAFVSAGVFGMAYLILALTAKRKLYRNSKYIADSMRLQLKTLQEGLGGIRDIILDNTQDNYISIFRKIDIPKRQKIAQNESLQQLPRYAFEALGLVLIASFAYFFVNTSSLKSNIIPILGAIALGAQRLLPAMQQVYSSWASIKALTASVIDVQKMLDQPINSKPIYDEDFDIEFRNNINLVNVTFKYKNKVDPVINNISLNIQKGECLGIVGETGSGKTTLIDIIMGLLKPTNGKILIDHRNIYEGNQYSLVKAWRRLVAHIPQDIYLADTTIAENIAFGINPEYIDLNKVKDAARKAKIHEFIEQTLGGYNSYIGERGLRISGGQKQRIGIARALYKQSKLLILDEATSALDNRIEEKVMNSIYNLDDKPTIIMIAHRLTTLANCDRIIYIKKGNLAKSGRPKDILPLLSKTSIN